MALIDMPIDIGIANQFITAAQASFAGSQVTDLLNLFSLIFG
ncbi:hypothetical protein [Methanosarcina barkeri]|nr:hypothetical protein [Methanosarcina barkeri]